MMDSWLERESAGNQNREDCRVVKNQKCSITGADRKREEFEKDKEIKVKRMDRTLNGEKNPDLESSQMQVSSAKWLRGPK